MTESKNLEFEFLPTPSITVEPIVHVVPWEGDEPDEVKRGMQGFVEVSEKDGVYYVPLIGTTDHFGSVTGFCVREFEAGFTEFLRTRGIDEGWVYAPAEAIRAAQEIDEVDGEALQA